MNPVKLLRTILCFYGPPASGKSTACDWAAKQGILALDFEKFKSPEFSKRLGHRLTALAELAYDVYGMADIRREEAELRLGRNPRVKHVLILPPLDVYVLRRELRDAAFPEKAAQGDYYDGFAQKVGDYDLVISDPKRLIGETFWHKGVSVGGFGNG